MVLGRLYLPSGIGGAGDSLTLFKLAPTQMRKALTISQSSDLFTWKNVDTPI
jgi:hypothetical protein